MKITRTDAEVVVKTAEVFPRIVIDSRDQMIVMVTGEVGGFGMYKGMVLDMGNCIVDDGGCGPDCRVGTETNIRKDFVSDYTGTISWAND